MIFLQIESLDDIYIPGFINIKAMEWKRLLRSRDRQFLDYIWREHEKAECILRNPHAFDIFYLNRLFHLRSNKEVEYDENFEPVVKKPRLN